MSRNTRNQKLLRKLQAAEADFLSLLTSALKRCTDGSVGIFFTEERAHTLGGICPRLVWPEAKELARLGREIHSLRTKLGEPVDQSLYSRYLEWCAMDGPNDLGGARLARKFLAEIETKSVSTRQEPS